jgi:hypothetical protein
MAFSMGGMEGCWMFGVFCLLEARTAPEVFPAAGLMPGLPIALALMRIARALPRPLRMAVGLFGGLIWLMLFIKFSAFPGQSLMDPAWFAAGFGRFFQTQGGPNALQLTALAAAATWIAGLRLAGIQTGFAQILSEFQFGLVILLLVFFCAAQWQIPLPALTPIGKRRPAAKGASLNMNAHDISGIQAASERFKHNVGQAVIGQSDVLELIFIALLCEGHVLIEDVPGVGKTLLARATARSLDGHFKRIQCTPDLLPSDVVGLHFFNQKLSEFEFRPGPVLANVVLVDEINRAMPRTQSCLLESMQERQVTVDWKTVRSTSALHSNRHPKPNRAGGHLSAAGSSARPVSDEAEARLPLCAG